MRRSRAHVAACAVVLLVTAQLAGLWHQAVERHITCSEHGEQVDAATLVGDLHACDHDHLVGVESGHAGSHEDCAIARALHQSAQTSGFTHAPALVPLVTTTGATVVTSTARTRALYRIAPKTSPPAGPRTSFA
jgi:hypothetical protein